MAWPTDLSSAGSLYVQINSFATTLNGGISAGAASATLTTTSPLPSVGIITVESEAIRYGANSTATSVLSSLTRAFDSTTAAAHGDGVAVYANHVAIHHNALKDAIIALEADLASRLSQSATAITNSVGDISASRANVGANVQINCTNSNNTDTASHSVIAITSGGASGGDPYINVSVSGVTNWSFGIDNSDSDAFCFTAASTLNGTNILKLSTTGAITIGVQNLTVTRSQSGDNVGATLYNTSNTASSNALLQLEVAGTSAGDPYVEFIVDGGSPSAWSFGVDNSDADAVCLAAATTLSGTNILRITTSSMTVGADHYTARSQNGGTVFGQVENTSNTASSNARMSIVVAGTSAGDPFTVFTVTGTSNWAVGLDNSDSDAFKISASATLGTSDIIRATSTTFDPVGAGSISTGDASNYWNDVSYKTLTDRGCLPWCDNGVELRDGTLVSDLDALSQIKKHPTRKTGTGLPRLDYSTFPKHAYRAVEDEFKDEVIERDKNGDAWVMREIDGVMTKVPAHDGVEMTMVFGVMIGAFKQTKTILDDHEERLRNLEVA